MGFFKKEKTMDELDSDLERAKIQEEIDTHEANSAERQAVIKELKRKYGSGWQRILGANSNSPLSTLRSFLSSAKQGLKSEAGKAQGGGNTGMNLARLRGEGGDGTGNKLRAGGSQTAIGRLSTGAGSGGGQVKA